MSEPPTAPRGQGGSVLLVEDDANLAFAVTRFLTLNGFSIHHAPSAAQALAGLASRVPDYLLVDVGLPDRDGIDLVKDLRSLAPEAAVVIVTAMDDARTLARALKAGVTDYLVKPVDLEVLLHLLIGIEDRQRRSAQLAHLLSQSRRPLLGEHPSIVEVRGSIALVVGRRDLCVLVHGETGTGKEVVAHALHDLDGREGPLVDLNCAAVGDTLFESELFGYEAGAFTDARVAKKGLLEVADRGTLFLDEIGEMPASLQPKLLRAIEERAFRKVGGVATRTFDARIVSATLRRPDDLVGSGRLRADLYFRLAGYAIGLPPLRERGEDVILLAEYFLERISLRQAGRALGLSPQARGLLLGYAWPGNVRELRNVIERAAILSTDGAIRPVHLPADLAGGTGTEVASETAPGVSIRPLRDIEREHLGRALAHFGGNLSAAARALGLSRTTLRERLRRHGHILPPEEAKSGKR